LAQEPVGCDKFKWPLDKERATLNGTDLPKLASGDRAPWQIPFASIVALVPFADVKLPAAPERAPKSPTSFAGFVQVPAPSRGGTYKVSLSSEGWIDVVQDGHAVKSSAFSGATGCEGLRKSVKFELAAQPFTVELSGIPADTIRIAITSD
jgi:predicted lipoprotein